MLYFIRGLIVGGFDFCSDFCKNISASLISVHSTAQNNFINGMMAGKASWLGTKNIKNGQLPVNWDFDMTRIDFTALDSKQGWPHSSQEEIGLVMCYDQVSKNIDSRPVTDRYEIYVFLSRLPAAF